MLKAKRPTDHSAGTKHRTPFWKSAHTPTVPPQASEAETIKPKTVLKQPPAIIGASRSQAPGQIATYTRQNPTSASYNVLRSSVPAQIVHDARNAVSTTSTHVPIPVSHSQPATSAPVQFKPSTSIPKPEPSVPSKNLHVQLQQQAHRTSVQSLNSTNTESTSRSSFERISTENLQHSWRSGATFSTAPSSMPQSTESLTRIPVGHPGANENREGQYNNPNLPSRRFPLVESDKPASSPSKTYGHDTQGEQASDALPLPNSEYESPARVHSLRRSKPNINVSSTSVRVATSTTGRQSPVPSPEEVPPTPEVLKSPSFSESRDHHRSYSDMLDVAYIRRNHVEQTRGDHQAREAMLARVMQASSVTSRQSQAAASTASTRSMSTQAPRVPAISQLTNPNMTKLKQTSVPRISTSGISTGSPMIEQTRPPFDSLQSPLKASAETSWTAVRSPTMTSAPAYSTLTSVVMSPNLSSITSPRTLVSSSQHHSEVAPIQPSQHYYNLSSAGSVVGRSPIVESDYDSSPSTAVPNTPTSHTVRALFSSFTSRSHRNSTPHPLRSSLSNPPITSQEVDSPRILPAHILTPPPLPPQSTRPDAPQQSFTHPQSQQEMLNQIQLGGPPPYSATSPRHGTADLRSNLKSSGDNRRETVPSGLRSPSPTSILRSYGLGANNSPHTPLLAAQRALAGSPFEGRTLMSDSEVTTVTTVSVTRSTVVMPAGQQVPYNPHMERRSSSASKRESSVVSTTRNTSQSQPIPPRSSSPAPNGGLFGLFRPKSPRHPFPTPDRASSPAPPPLPSKTPPPRSATASPSRKFAFSIPINLRHKAKKSISGASVEAVIGGERLGMGGDSAMSSQGSLLQAKAPETHYVAGGHSEVATRRLSTIGFETDTEIDGGGDDDVDIEEALALKMMAVEQWKSSTEGTFAQSGKRRPRAGVSFELPASESERDDTAMTAVSVAPGGGRFLRLARRPRQHQQFSDNESTVFVEHAF